jgi:hypothetical protein
MPRRSLRFAAYEDAIAEIDRLFHDGYEASSHWTLGQICRHLSFYLRGSLEGFGSKLPWIVRILVGPLVLRRILRSGRMPDNAPTIPKSVPGEEADEAAAVAEARLLLERLARHTGELHPSPLFGKLSPQRWRELHLIHAAHHLSFLEPKDMAGEK